MGIKQKIMGSLVPFVGNICKAPTVLPVIYYHDIVNDGEGYSYMRTDVSRFEEQMKYLSEAGYKTLLFSELPKEMDKKRNEKAVLITFDDGFLSNYTVAFPIMKKYGLKFNVYLAYDYIGTENYMSKEQLLEMQESGIVEFGYHTKSHCDSRTLTDERLFEEELVEGKRLLEELLSRKVNDYCFPYGYYSKEVIGMVDERGLFDRMYTSNYVKPTRLKNSIVCGRIGIHTNWQIDAFKKHLSGKYRIMHYYSKLRVGVPKVK